MAKETSPGPTTGKKELKPDTKRNHANWGRELKTPEPVRQAALVFSGMSPEQKMSKGEYKRTLDAFLKANPADRRK